MIFDQIPFAIVHDHSIVADALALLLVFYTTIIHDQITVQENGLVNRRFPCQFLHGQMDMRRVGFLKNLWRHRRPLWKLLPGIPVNYRDAGII